MKTPHVAIQKNDLMRLVTKGLNRNERLIIILYYYEELTMKEIGAKRSISPKAALVRCTAASFSDFNISSELVVMSSDAVAVAPSRSNDG